MKKNKLIFGILSLVCLVLMLLPFLITFKHGFYTNKLETNIIDNNTFYMDVNKTQKELIFIPINKNDTHNSFLEGIKLYFLKDFDSSGDINLYILDDLKKVESITININDIVSNSWNQIEFNEDYEMEKEYKLLVSCDNCKGKIQIASNENNKIFPETVKGDFLVNYGYSYETFLITDKLLISFLVCIIWIFSLLLVIPKEKHKKIKKIVFFLLLLFVMVQNYTYTEYASHDSEHLIKGVIEASKNNDIKDSYGLGYYMNETYLSYPSQVGLQGKLFVISEKIMNYNLTISHLNFLISISTSLILLGIVFLLQKKYNKLMAASFYIVFLLSPWILNFDSNLYWMTAFLFAPILVGLFLSLYKHNKKLRYISYALVFGTIFIKCLSGYEYISAIMLSMIAFLIVDLIKSIMKNDKIEIKSNFKTIIITGIISLIAFFSALCIHAYLRSGGNILEGIKIIFEQDVLRRTSANNLENFDPVYWPSLSASVYEVLCMYLKFPTDIILGISGYLFPIYCLVAISILIHNVFTKKDFIEELVLFIIFGLSAISWLVLAKGHSYIHTHLNYILWYFGFVQICFYIIIKKIVEFVKKEKNKE